MKLFGCEETQSSWKIWKKRRYVVGIMVFFGYFNMHALRSNLSIAIVAMTENKTSEGENITYGKEFDWDSKIQGHILSSSYYGYISTQLLGGWLAAKIGGNKRVSGIGVALAAVATLLTPIAAKQSFYLVIVVRILEGMSEGAAFPCLHAMWVHWAPPLEKARLATMGICGCLFGTITAMPVCAFLSNTCGWESIFYVFGVVALVWFALWWWMVAETPSEDSKISEAELNYIRDSLGDTKNVGPIKHPWKSIFTSLPVWAIVVVNFATDWGFFTFLTLLPTFMKDVLYFDLGKIGIMSVLPYLAMAITMQLGGYYSDWLQRKGILTTTQIRKLCVCSGLITLIVFIQCLAHLSSPIACMFSLVLAAGAIGLCSAGFNVNYLDVAPQHASIVIAISNTLGTLPGILIPVTTGYIVSTPNQSEWQIVFYIATAVYAIGFIVYFVFASGEVQSWVVESSNVNQDKPEINSTEDHENCSDRYRKIVV